MSARTKLLTRGGRLRRGETTHVAEFGTAVHLAPGPRTDPVVTVQLTGKYTSGTGSFGVPITLNLHPVGADGAVGSLLATTTNTFTFPFAQNVDRITFDLAGSHAVLPDDVTASVAFDTTDAGYQPTGVNGQGCDSLDIAVSTTAPATTGTASTTSTYLYVKGGGAGRDDGKFNVLAQDTSADDYTGQPLISIATS